MADAVEALVTTGDYQLADHYLAMFADRVRTYPRPTAQAWLARCEGLVRHAHGDLDRAVAALERAVDAHQHAPSRFEHARTLLILGGVQRRNKRKAAARQTLTEALNIFDQFSASLWAQRARDQINRIGGRSTVVGLTVVERRVAELAAAGLQDKQIASQLYISTHTVSAHLRTIYRKLGIRSRTALATRLAQHRPAGKHTGGGEQN